MYCSFLRKEARSAEQIWEAHGVGGFHPLSNLHQTFIKSFLLILLIFGIRSARGYAAKLRPLTDSFPIPERGGAYIPTIYPPPPYTCSSDHSCNSNKCLNSWKLDFPRFYNLENAS